MIRIRGILFQHDKDVYVGQNKKGKHEQMFFAN
jgi:hypothetical protein